jgi:L-fuconate dehydratase
VQNVVIRDFEILDLRFPTSRTMDGSDAMHRDPDYSAAYLILKTSADLEGHGFTFTLGRGNEICVAAIRALQPLVVGKSLAEITAAPGQFWRSLASDTQMRWLGPEKGAVHLALAAVINAVWDLWAKAEGKPVWKLLADMSPREVVNCVDFRYIDDALSPDEALEMLERQAPGKQDREAKLLREGYPAYTTSTGWIGYSEDRVRALCREALAQGWTAFKVKVGGAPAEDARRLALVREEIGASNRLMTDANQFWGVNEAIARVKELAKFNLWWIEEPTSPDDILGHAKIAEAVRPLGIGVATGENCANRVIFKQLLQARAIDFCQIDSCRLGGVNENLAVILMAAKFGVPVCPHAGGVGLCELVQHLSMFDFIGVSGRNDDRVIEFVDHLHQHMVDPVAVRDGRYFAPTRPGYSTEIHAESRREFAFPDGPVWRTA